MFPFSVKNCIILGIVSSIFAVVLIGVHESSSEMTLLCNLSPKKKNGIRKGIPSS